jgi:DNA-binding phage protein
MTYRVDTYHAERLPSAVKRYWAAKLELSDAGHYFKASVRARYAAGATLQQLADATGLTRQRIQQIVSERGER